jgi:cytoskeletal protein CcmA (bactofilin family)
MTTIGPSLTITGEITSHEDITLQGCINGKITMQGGALVVAPQGKVDADVLGSHMTIQAAGWHAHFRRASSWRLALTSGA